MTEAPETEIVLGEGVRLVPATNELLAEVEANLRPGDKAEHDFGGGNLRRPDRHSPVWAILDGKDLLGAGGWLIPADGTWLAPVRVAWFLSTRKVDARKKKFVRLSPRVLAAMAKTLPPWVDRIVVCPMNLYPMSIKWLKRVMKMRVLCEKKVDGAMFTILMADRKELENV